MADKMDNFDFEKLAQQISSTSDALRCHAAHAINRDVTTRAWITGYYIVEYEQHGANRAKYGDGLINKLAAKLDDKSLSASYLKSARTLYFNYPQLAMPIVDFIRKEFSIGQSPIVRLEMIESQVRRIGQSAIVQSERSLNTGVEVSPDILFSRLSCSHLLRLMPVKDPLQRTFYELSAISGVWSVKELERQIKSNYYVRSGWSVLQPYIQGALSDRAQGSSAGLCRRGATEYVPELLPQERDAAG